MLYIYFNDLWSIHLHFKEWSNSTSLLTIPKSITFWQRIWTRKGTKWLNDIKGTRKHHGTARNLRNEKVVSSISAWMYMRIWTQHQCPLKFSTLVRPTKLCSKNTQHFLVAILGIINNIAWVGIGRWVCFTQYLLQVPHIETWGGW